jgi:hypothetical protein
MWLPSHVGLYSLLSIVRFSIYEAQTYVTIYRYLYTVQFVLTDKKKFSCIVFTVKSAIFCDMTSCNLVDCYQLLGGIYCLHLQT